MTRRNMLPRAGIALHIAAGVLCLLGAGSALGDPGPDIRSAHAFVYDDEAKHVIFERDADVAAPIASITKLMLAMVVLDANLDPNEPIKIVREDKPQTSKFTRSPLTFGMVITRENLLRVALMASDNRAAESLARTFPGGTAAAIAAMNRKAAELGLTATRFEDPTGLDAGNVSTAHELSTLVAAARSYPLICEYTTTRELDVRTSRGTLKFINTDVLLRRKDWSIDLSKTGYINEAGRCLVLHATIAERPMTVVLLGANGKYTAVADASRLRAWLEPGRVAPKAPPKGKTGERSP